MFVAAESRRGGMVMLFHDDIVRRFDNGSIIDNGNTPIIAYSGHDIDVDGSHSNKRSPISCISNVQVGTRQREYVVAPATGIRQWSVTR